MCLKKRKKHDHVALKKYMRLLDEGYSISYVHKNYGICKEQLSILRCKYLKEGDSALYRKKNIKADFALKKQIVLDIEENHLTLHTASLKYGACPHRIRIWLKIAHTEGIAALSKIRKRGRPPKNMGRPKKNSKPLSELERLQKENQELKTEIALLKKVRALVEERNARLREIGHGPSKN